MRSGCLYCGYCTRFGCEVDAKSSAQTTHLPPALGDGPLRNTPELRRCTRRQRGQQTGWRPASPTSMPTARSTSSRPTWSSLSGLHPDQRAHAAALARATRIPDGIGNDRGLVGKNYTYQHWHTVATGVFPESDASTCSWATPPPQNVIFDFNGDNFDHSNVDFVGGAMLFSTLGERDPHHLGRRTARRSGNGQESLGQRSGKWKDAPRRVGTASPTFVMQGESLPYEDQYLGPGPGLQGCSSASRCCGSPSTGIKNDYTMYSFIAQKGKEIMQTDGPRPIRTTYALSLDPYNIHKYQSTHLTGGAIMGTTPATPYCNKLWPGLGYARTSSSPAPRSTRRTPG